MARKTKSRNPRRVRKTRRQKGGDSSMGLTGAAGPTTPSAEEQFAANQAMNDKLMYEKTMADKIAAEAATAETTSLAAPTTTAPTTTAPTTSVPAPPGPPVTPQTINSTVEEIKTLLNDIYSNPTISASARNAVSNAQNLISNPQLTTNLGRSINNLKGSAPVAAALAQAFALVSLQLIKEPALLQILQSLQAQYKNIMKPSVQAAMIDLFNKLLPLLEPSVITALNTEVNNFMNASLSNPNIRNTVGQIVNNSASIVSAAPVQAAIDTAVV